jgi:hypothetical protein
VAVLFAQSFADRAGAEVVSEIERVGSGISQQTWQKIIILQATIHDGRHCNRRTELAPGAARVPCIVGG